ncbi:MAG: hypothetical protein ACI9MR_003194 [Myxococcota bacterium]|jgi:hypothetical protein
MHGRHGAQAKDSMAPLRAKFDKAMSACKGTSMEKDFAGMTWEKAKGELGQLGATKAGQSLDSAVMACTMEKEGELNKLPIGGHFWDFKKAQKAAMDAPEPTDNNRYKTYMQSWARSVNDFFLKEHCTKGKNPEKCKEVADQKTLGLQKQVDGVEAGLKSAEIEFNHIDSNVFEMCREPDFDPLGKYDTWITQLAKEKTACWKDEVGSPSKVAKYAEENRDAVCVSTKGNKIDYLFGEKDKLGISCGFLTATKNLKRDDKDYWKVEYKWASRLNTLKS